MSKKCYRFFGGLLNAQVNWLNQMSQKGYRLVRTGRVLYEFEECSPDEVTYCVEFIGEKSKENATDYANFLEDMHHLARADFPNRKQIVHEILHPEDRPAPQSSYSHYSGINYSALEVAVRRIQQDFDFLMRYLPKLPDDSYAKTETLKILKQHKAYMAQFEEMLNDKEIA